MTEQSQTETHVFYIKQHALGYFEAEFQPINRKTGKPWQASHGIETGADVIVSGYDRPIAFSTIEAARAAVELKKAQLAKR